jgi:hypothetical protein
MLVFRKVRGIAANQGGTTDKLLFVLGRNSVEGVFYFFGKGDNYGFVN